MPVVDRVAVEQVVTAVVQFPMAYASRLVAATVGGTAISRTVAGRMKSSKIGRIRSSLVFDEIINLDLINSAS